jgi:hypothetical protein
MRIGFEFDKKRQWTGKVVFWEIFAMRMIAILAVAVMGTVYMGIPDQNLLVWGMPFSLVASTIAAIGMAYVLVVIPA